MEGSPNDAKVQKRLSGTRDEGEEIRRGHPRWYRKYRKYGSILDWL